MDMPDGNLVGVGIREGGADREMGRERESRKGINTIRDGSTHI